MRELNLLEGTFLSADSEWSVGHSGVLASFDRAGRPEPSIDEVRAHVAERVARIEALQWKVVPHPSRPGRRCLVEAGPPDLEHHVREAPVPAPGGQREVGRVAAELNDRSLDREHALWELHVLRGARGPRLPVLVKLHHAIADGATTVEVWEGLFGADSAAPPSRPPERGVAGPADDDGAPVEPLAPAPRTRFNGAPSGTHDFAFASLDVEPLQTARRAAGVSFTEGLMAVVAGALRSWLADRGELPAEPLYASLPASLRRSGEEYRFENLLTLLVV